MWSNTKNMNTIVRDTYLLSFQIVLLAAFFVGFLILQSIFPFEVGTLALGSNSCSNVIGDLIQNIQVIFLNQYVALWPNFIKNDVQQTYKRRFNFKWNHWINFSRRQDVHILSHVRWDVCSKDSNIFILIFWCGSSVNGEIKFFVSSKWRVIKYFNNLIY